VTRTCAFVSLAALAALATAAPAQVGYPPSASPYQDFSNKQEFTIYSGWFTGATGRAGVGPHGGAMLGLRYGLKLGGPVELDVHAARVFTQRDVISPGLIGPARNLGSFSLPLYLGDVGLTFNMTGAKSWHHLIPTFGFGGGVVSDAGTNKDVGGFHIGTAFAITFGGGIRYVPGGNWSVRAELADYMYQAEYPNSYFLTPPGGKSVLPPSSAQNQWLHNGALTLGISYLIGR